MSFPFQYGFPADSDKRTSLFQYTISCCQKGFMGQVPCCSVLNDNVYFSSGIYLGLVFKLA